MIWNNAKKIVIRSIHNNPVVIVKFLLLVGVSGIVYGHYFGNPLIEKLASAVFSAGLFSAFFKAIQATGVFSDELTKILYLDPTNKYLELRKDIPTLWSNLTKILHGNAFPQLNEKIAETIRENYLPSNFEYYFDKVSVTARIEWLDQGKNLVKITTIINGQFVPKRDIAEATYKCDYRTKAVHGLEQQHEWLQLKFGTLDAIKEGV